MSPSESMSPTWPLPLASSCNYIGYACYAWCSYRIIYIYIIKAI